MKREINMRWTSPETKKSECEVKSGVDMSADDKINTDPFGSWTGVSTDDKYEKPVQDADDL